jgi:hypothetical protein
MTKTFFALFAALSLSVHLSATAQAEVFMLARANVMGSPQSIAVLFSDKELKTIEDCQEEKRMGQKGNWAHYYHFVTPFWKRYINAAYFCVNTDRRIAKWFDDEHYDDTYRITIVNNHSFKLLPYGNLADCTTALRKEKLLNRHDIFCARMNQKIWEAGEQETLSASK